MADNLTQTKDKNRTPVDIPWMHLWDQKKCETKTERFSSKRLRLENIEYMNMLEELAFH